MTRLCRIQYCGACFHVINRGNYRRDLFNLPGAADAFESTLFEACQSFQWTLHAYVIMRNHFHLALQLGAPTLSSGMKWLQGTWSARFNRFHRQVGRPFQGRFKAKHVQPGPPLSNVVHYIHLNPARAGVVGLDKLGSYRHSSLWHYIQTAPPQWLAPAAALVGAGNLPNSADGWSAYRTFLAEFANAETQERRELYQSIRRGWCMGAEEFKEEVKSRLGIASGERPSFARPTGPEWKSEQENRWETELRRAAAGAGIELASLPVPKSARVKLVLAAHMRAVSNVSNGWLAARLGMGRPASVSQFLRRYRLIVPSSRWKLTGSMSTVDT